MRAVKRGDIYHRYFETTKPPKYKFFVVVGEDQDSFIGYFFINSNINKYIERNQEMFNMQLSISPDKYSFLNHLSFIDGHALSKLPKNKIIQELSEGKTIYKGVMLKEDIDILLKAALESPLFTQAEKKYFL